MAGDAASLMRAPSSASSTTCTATSSRCSTPASSSEVGQRWFGVVRETLEFEAALARVVVPEVPDAATRCRTRAAPAALVERLQAYDELNSDRSPDVVRGLATETVEALRGPGAGARCPPCEALAATSGTASARTCARSWGERALLVGTHLSVLTYQ